MCVKSYVIKNENLIKPLNPHQQKQSIELFQKFNPNDYIYPGVLIRTLNTAMKNAYSILFELEKMGALHQNYEVICQTENKTIGPVYENLKDLLSAEPFYCDSCEAKVIPSESNIMIFKVIERFSVSYE